MDLSLNARISGGGFVNHSLPVLFSSFFFFKSEISLCTPDLLMPFITPLTSEHVIRHSIVAVYIVPC